MAASRFHLGWFLNFVPDAWNETWGSGGDPWDGRFYIEMAQALEQAARDRADAVVELLSAVPARAHGRHHGSPRPRP